MATAATRPPVDLALLAGSWWSAKEPQHALCRRRREFARWLYLLGRCFEGARGLRFRAEWRHRLRTHRSAQFRAAELWPADATELRPPSQLRRAGTMRRMSVRMIDGASGLMCGVAYHLMCAGVNGRTRVVTEILGAGPTLAPVMVAPTRCRMANAGRTFGAEPTRPMSASQAFVGWRWSAHRADANRLRRRLSSGLTRSHVREARRAVACDL